MVDVNRKRLQDRVRTMVSQENEAHKTRMRLLDDTLMMIQQMYVDENDVISPTRHLETNNPQVVNAPLNSILSIELPPANGEARTIKVAVSESGAVIVDCNKHVIMAPITIL